MGPMESSSISPSLHSRSLPNGSVMSMMKRTEIVT